MSHEADRYYSDEAMLLNVVPKFVPIVVAAVMIATAIRDAIRPYSIAVAPPSSWAKRITSVVILGPTSLEQIA